MRIIGGAGQGSVVSGVKGGTRGAPGKTDPNTRGKVLKAIRSEFLINNSDRIGRSKPENTITDRGKKLFTLNDATTAIETRVNQAGPNAATATSQKPYTTHVRGGQREKQESSRASKTHIVPVGKHIWHRKMGKGTKRGKGRSQLQRNSSRSMDQDIKGTKIYGKNTVSAISNACQPFCLGYEEGRSAGHHSHRIKRTI